MLPKKSKVCFICKPKKHTGGLHGLEPLISELPQNHGDFAMICHNQRIHFCRRHKEFHEAMIFITFNHSDILTGPLGLVTLQGVKKSSIEEDSTCMSHENGTVLDSGY